jgi:hypothetical protein
MVTNDASWTPAPPVGSPRSGAAPGAPPPRFGAQHGPDTGYGPVRAYWMAVATRMSSSGVIRWSWLSSPIAKSTQFTVPLKRLASPE